LQNSITSSAGINAESMTTGELRGCEDPSSNGTLVKRAYQESNCDLSLIYKVVHFLFQHSSCSSTRLTLASLPAGITSMQAFNHLQKALKRGGPVFGAWQVRDQQNLVLFWELQGLKFEDAPWNEPCKSYC
jgi:penicillin-binding protein-related factor A (putative recombinase)